MTYSNGEVVTHSTDGSHALTTIESTNDAKRLFLVARAATTIAQRSPSGSASSFRLWQEVWCAILEYVVRQRGQPLLYGVCVPFLYHQSRPNQEKNDQLLVHAKSRRKTERPATISIAKVRCEQKLGGLLKSYRWAA